MLWFIKYGSSLFGIDASSDSAKFQDHWPSKSRLNLKFQNQKLAKNGEFDKWKRRISHRHFRHFSPLPPLSVQPYRCSIEQSGAQPHTAMHLCYLQRLKWGHLPFAPLFGDRTWFQPKSNSGCLHGSHYTTNLTDCLSRVHPAWNSNFTCCCCLTFHEKLK